jgi:hypothetical protein
LVVADRLGRRPPLTGDVDVSDVGGGGCVDVGAWVVVVVGGASVVVGACVVVGASVVVVGASVVVVGACVVVSRGTRVSPTPARSGKGSTSTPSSVGCMNAMKMSAGIVPPVRL